MEMDEYLNWCYIYKKQFPDSSKAINWEHGDSSEGENQILKIIWIC